MGKQVNSRFGWRWILVAMGGLSWISLGCSPQTLSVFLMPFTDTNVEPEYKLFAKEKEITLAIRSNFVRPELHPDLQPAAVELADLVSASIRKRCAENKHKIKIVPNAQVCAEEARQNQLTGGTVGAVELGKSLKADFVLELTINSFTILEKNFSPPHYRGRANINIDLYKMDSKDGDYKVFGPKDLSRVFPREPVDADGLNLTNFRRGFLGKAANDIAKTFISYPPDEQHQIE